MRWHRGKRVSETRESMRECPVGRKRKLMAPIPLCLRVARGDCTADDDKEAVLGHSLSSSSMTRCMSTKASVT
jgi:hypothetical protein